MTVPRNLWHAQIRERIAHNRQIEEDRRLRRINSEILTVEGLAELLFCSTQAVRSIPTNDLPRYSSPGRRVLFLREDVYRYLRGRHRRRGGIDVDMVRAAEAKVLGSESDSGRRRSRKETGND